MHQIAVSESMSSVEIKSGCNVVWRCLKSFVASCRANAEIAQVRAKAKQEQAAYQASLRKEQMKVDSLERTLDQKVCPHCHTCPLSVILAHTELIHCNVN